MSTTTKLLSAVGYVKAPRVTLFVKHPVKALSAWVAWRAAKKAAPRRAKTTMAAAGALAATAVAAPLAIKALRERDAG